MGQSEHVAAAANEVSSPSPDLVIDEKPTVEHIERPSETEETNLTYDDIDEEPELHVRTYVALASMFLLNLVQVFALQGPPAVVRN